MNRNLTDVFELAGRHQLEVNAGLAKPDNVGLNLMSYEVLPPMTPLLVVSREISVVRPEDRSIVIKSPYPYASASGGYRGFSWVIERTEHDQGDIDRFVLGALIKNDYNKNGLWTPVDTIEVWDVYDELKDEQLAQDIIEILTASESVTDAHEFLRLCEQIPDTDSLKRLYIALINSVVGPEEIFSSVRSPVCLEDFERYYYSWGEELNRPTSYPVKTGDIFAFSYLEGNRTLVVSRRFSDKRVHEKNVVVSSKYGFERAG